MSSVEISSEPIQAQKKVINKKKTVKEEVAAVVQSTVEVAAVDKVKKTKKTKKTKAVEVTEKKKSLSSAANITVILDKIVAKYKDEPVTKDSLILLLNGDIPKQCTSYQVQKIVKPVKAKKVKHPEQPRGLKNSYMWYCSEKTAEKKADGTSISKKELGDVWKALSPEQKAPYKLLQDNDKVRFSTEYAAFVAKYPEFANHDEDEDEDEDTGVTTD